MRQLNHLYGWLMSEGGFPFHPNFIAPQWMLYLLPRGALVRKAFADESLVRHVYDCYRYMTNKASMTCANQHKKREDTVLAPPSMCLAFNF